MERVQNVLQTLARKYNDAVVDYPEIPEAEYIENENTYVVRLVTPLDDISRIVVVEDNDTSIDVTHDFFGQRINSTLTDEDDWEDYLYEVFGRFIRWVDSITTADIDETVFDMERPKNTRSNSGFVYSGEALRKKVKVVRGGKVRIIRKKAIKYKVRLTPAQKMALRKAIKKAHTPQAQRKRKKSMLVRKRKHL